MSELYSQPDVKAAIDAICDIQRSYGLNALELYKACQSVMVACEELMVANAQDVESLRDKLME